MKQRSSSGEDGGEEIELEETKKEWKMKRVEELEGKESEKKRMWIMVTLLEPMSSIITTDIWRVDERQQSRFQLI